MEMILNYYKIIIDIFVVFIFDFMKFIITLLFLILSFVQINAQCVGGQLGGFTQSLNCYNDSAGILQLPTLLQLCLLINGSSNLFLK